MAARRADSLPELPSEPGAYVLLIDLDQPLAPALPRRPATRLEPGRYAYCGSAWGPGGLRARLARHLRADKTPRWHVDRLTAVGAVAGIVAVPGARECELRARLARLPGVSVPVAGFGSSDCRTCPAHLLAVPRRFGPAALARRMLPSGGDKYMVIKRF